MKISSDLTKQIKNRFNIKAGYRVEFVNCPPVSIEANSFETAYEEVLERFPGRVVGCLIDIKNWFDSVIAPAAEKAYMNSKYF